MPIIYTLETQFYVEKFNVTDVPQDMYLDKFFLFFSGRLECQRFDGPVFAIQNRCDFEQMTPIDLPEFRLEVGD